ncbi:hypothetical protein AJ79_09441 [Helicocarpus griseus UAMH5409]|uniref:Uncharacterized protein n=1 Tax=Helicocarpus griseus UAMH5409 TaxID=1447875 RepID=A0A2B7WJA8_9EURO|nr:hypothetical protein AJ79_09441 [Helicocarpus griseus UAMH5409]
MFARLKNMVAPPNPSAHVPSALIVVSYKNSKSKDVLHLVPEDGTIERWGYMDQTPNTTFRYSGATEQTREQVGEVTIYAGDGESLSAFLQDVETRARQLWDDSPSLKQQAQSQKGGDGPIQLLIHDVLQPAALDAIRKREGRERSFNATQTYDVFVLRVMRSKAGKILSDELTSFAQ